MGRPRKNADTTTTQQQQQAPASQAPARTSVSMVTTLHAKLKIIAAEESERTKQKVSVADLVEQAVVAMWPSTHSYGEVVRGGAVGKQLTAAAFVDDGSMGINMPAPAPVSSDDQRQALLDELLAAQASEFDTLFVAALADPIPDVICGLEGTVAGSFGPIARRDLAYHLRGALNSGRAICSLDELIVDYQG